MIQFKKIPPSKSVILLLLFLTTNVCGFQRETQDEYQTSRKIQDRYSMDLQQSQNMPIRRVGINRVINEKDGNAERLYDRRSFRTGTIERTDDVRRSTERQHRARVDVRADLNNNRELLTRNSPVQSTRNNRQSFESTISRDNRQRQPEDRRFGERAVISRNRQYEERSLETRTERDLDRRVERSFNIRDRRNSNFRDLDRRVNERRTADETRSTSAQRIGDEHRDARHLQARRTSELLQGQSDDTRATRLAESRFPETLIETRRSARLADSRDRRSSTERDLNQRRSFTERYSREHPLERRLVESRDRNLDQRRSSDERNINRVRSSTERLERMNSRLERMTSRLEMIHSRLERIHSRENILERRSVDRHNRKTSEIRNNDQRRSSSEERNMDQTRASTRLTARQTRLVQNENLDRRDQRRSSEDRMGDRIRSAERLERLSSRQHLLQRRTVANRISERRQDQLAERLEGTNSQENRRSLEPTNRSIPEIRRFIEPSNSRERQLRNFRSTEETRIAQEDRTRDQRREHRRLTEANRITVESADRRSSSRDAQFRSSGNTEEIRIAQEDRARDQHRDHRRLTEARRITIASADRRDQRISGSRRTIDRLQRTLSGDRTVSLQRRERDLDERRTSNVRRASPNNRQLSRSDSTRYIQDNTNSRGIRMIYRKDSRTNENARRENIRITERYDPITADSRRYFEKIVSQRTTRDSERTAEMPALGLERNANNSDTYTWLNTAKIILAVFLVGQIFVNSSKANRFRFHNILSMATSIKEKVQ